MSSDDIAIRVSNLSKSYLIYETPRDRLKQFVLPRLQRIVGQAPKQYYREFRALNDVSFDVRKGETVGIIGRNGSGKSTLLQIICGTLTPTGGSVETRGRIAALLELGSGFNPDFTGRENVYVNASMLGLSNEETDLSFDDIAAFADIGRFIDQPVKTYSSGMVVRLAFAVQASIDPEILIVDEALAVGDEKFQRKCFARLEALTSRGTSILFVSHSGPQIVELCSRALFLERGESVLYSTPLHAVRTYQQVIYAPVAEQIELVQRIRQCPDAFGESTSGPAPSQGTCETSTPKAVTAVTEPEDSFDAGLVADTITVYPELGARIERIEIQTEDGRVVNVLKPSKRYRIVFAGRFLDNLEKVYFGIHIRSISGAVITGQRHPHEGEFIETARANKEFEVTYSFAMNLLPGTYFAGGGIWSATDAICVHRILDAAMFRIQNNGPQSAFGYCDLTASKAECRIS